MAALSGASGNTLAKDVTKGETMQCDSGQETVVLLHGLARSARAMRPMAKALEKAGYAVRNIDYPSTKHPVEALTQKVFTPLEPLLQNPACRVHFVTHSMGGILLRNYRYALAQQQPQTKLPGFGRVVMLSPPNQGSEVVDKLGDWRPFQWLNGPAGGQLGTDENSLPLQMGAADFELGIITGNRSINLILSQLIPGPDDGKVSVARAKLAGMNDFLVMPYSHTFIMRRTAVIEQVQHYLRQGRFNHAESSQ